MAKTHVLIADDEKGITDYLATRPDGAEIRRLSFEGGR